jgi:hypothetical protein
MQFSRQKLLVWPEILANEQVRSLMLKQEFRAGILFPDFYVLTDI